MNGAQDMGGKHGFGPVHPEPNEPVFHAEWEKRAFALTLAMGMPGGWNIDMSRFARENRPPTEYLSMSYYQIWFAALEHMIKERGLLSDDEVAAGHSLRPPKPVKRVLSPADVAKTLHRGGPTDRETNTKAQFKPGDAAIAVPGLPRDADGPVFREPWEAQAFAMTLALHERGVFTWKEWAAALADEIKRAQTAGDPYTGETYYSHWLNTLEKLVTEKGVTTQDTLHRYRDAWDRACDRTPHGESIELRDEDFR